MIWLFLSTIFVFMASIRAESDPKGTLLPPQVHAFVYLWYGEPITDNRYLHWNHEVLPHWEERVNAQFPEVGKRFEPPHNIHSPYYPLHGPYSSNDAATLQRQFKEMHEAGIEVAVVSWWGQRDKEYATDTQGVNTDLAVANLLEQADKFGEIKVALHLEPYHSRSVESVGDDIEYVHRMYGHHSSLLRSTDNRLVFYVYDSYHISPMYWARLLKDTGDITMRGTSTDSVMIGLWLHHHHGRDLKESGFDGVYTYFGTDGFSYGSTTTNWMSMCKFAAAQNMLCDISVGPGYNDSLIRPWNAHNSRARGEGQYYSRMWNKALHALPQVVSITSYNEWGEGTQIEPAMSYYLDRVKEKEHRLAKQADRRADSAEFSGKAAYDSTTQDATEKMLEEAKDPAFRALHERGQENDVKLARHFDDYGRAGPRLYLDLTRDFGAKFKAQQPEGGKMNMEEKEL